MKVVVISGSSRGGANSLKVAKWYIEQFRQKDVEAELLDLKKTNLPLVHEDIWDDIDNLPEAKEVRTVLDSADAFVLVTPEWHGMAAPAIKNLFVYVKKTMADKPTLLTAVSQTSYGGSFPIGELRASTAKNTRIAYIPEHIVVRDADHMMNSETPENKNDAYVQKRAKYAIDVLMSYAVALKTVRSSGLIDYKTYPNGM